MSQHITGNMGTSFKIGCVVERGGPDDPRQSKTKSGEVVARLPGVDGPGVMNEHLAMMGPQKSPESQCIFPGVLDHGTPVGVVNNTGDNRRIVSNIFTGTNETSDSPGNLNLMGQLQQFFEMSGGRSRPPKFKETQKDGAKIREIQELGSWAYNLTKGIPTHAAMAEIAGIKLPQIKNIPTALQHFSSILDGAGAQNIQGSSMSIGSVLPQVLTNSNNYMTITKDKEPAIVQAFESLAALSQHGEVIELGETVTGVRVQPEFFANACVHMFKQCETIADILNSMVELTCNTAHHGMPENDLILTLGEGEGDFIKGEAVYQVISNTEIALGNVIEWNSIQNLLEIKNVNFDKFDPSANVYASNAEYTISEHIEFCTGNTIIIESNTAFGASNIHIDIKGNVRELPNNSTHQAEQSYQSEMASSSSFPTSQSGGNMFGKSSGTMFDMFKRLPPEAMKKAKEVLDSIKNEDQNNKKVRNAAIKGGKPNRKVQYSA